MTDQISNTKLRHVQGYVFTGHCPSSA